MGKGLSITAFVFSFIIPIVGLILGIIAVSKSKDDPNSLRGLAIAAIVIGAIFTLIGVIFLIYMISFWNSVRGSIDTGEGSFTVMAPLISDSVRLSAQNDEIFFSVRNGNSQTMKITKIQVAGCSDDALIITQPAATMSPGALATIYYNSPGEEDCIKSGSKFTSAFVFYYTEGDSTIEKNTIGTIFNMGSE